MQNLCELCREEKYFGKPCTYEKAYRFIECDGCGMETKCHKTWAHSADILKEPSLDKKEINRMLNIIGATENINYYLNNKADQDNLTSLFKFDYSKEPQEGDEICSISGNRYRFCAGTWELVVNPSRDKNEGMHQPLTELIKPKQTMEKQIKMSLETARKMYEECKPTGASAFLEFLLENFTKEELEGKKGFTWEESFEPGYVIYEIGASKTLGIHKCSNPEAQDHFKNQYRTKEQAESALAFAQLSHIVPMYNEGKTPSKNENGVPVVYIVAPLHGNLGVYGLSIVDLWERFPFFTREDAKTSLEANKELWESYWMIHKTTSFVVETDRTNTN